MRILSIATALLLTASIPALAQDVIQDTGPHTMDGQLQNMQTHGYQPRKAEPSEMMMQAKPASGAMIESQGNGAIPANAIEVQTSGQVTYMTGGISDEEVNMLKAHANEFNLHVLINTTGGAYLVTDKFHIMDSQSVEVLRVDDAGPYVYAKLTPGTYTIEANEGGEIKTAKISVPAKGAAKVQMTFKQ